MRVCRTSVLSSILGLAVLAGTTSAQPADRAPRDDDRMHERGPRDDAPGAADRAPRGDDRRPPRARDDRGQRPWLGRRGDMPRPDGRAASPSGRRDARGDQGPRVRGDDRLPPQARERIRERVRSPEFRERLRDPEFRRQLRQRLAERRDRAGDRRPQWRGRGEGAPNGGPRTGHGPRPRFDDRGGPGPRPEPRLNDRAPEGPRRLDLDLRQNRRRPGA